MTQNTSTKISPFWKRLTNTAKRHGKTIEKQEIHPEQRLPLQASPENIPRYLHASASPVRIRDDFHAGIGFTHGMTQKSWKIPIRSFPDLPREVLPYHDLYQLRAANLKRKKRRVIYAAAWFFSAVAFFGSSCATDKLREVNSYGYVSFCLSDAERRWQNLQCRMEYWILQVP